MRYELRDASGALVAFHERVDTPNGKRFVWRQPNGAAGLGGATLADLPLFGTQFLGDWPAHRPVIIVEGEKAASALIDAGIPALGTATGASSTPGRLPLSELGGRIVVLW